MGNNDRRTARNRHGRRIRLAVTVFPPLHASACSRTVGLLQGLFWKSDDELLRAPRCRDQPHFALINMLIDTVLGTLLGTMFGIASAAVLTPLSGEEGTIGIPAAPGVVIGSSLGVLAAQASGDENQTARQLLVKLVLSLGVGAAATLACGRLLGGNLLREEGIVGIVMLATVASLGSTTVLVLNHFKGVLRGGTDELYDRGYLPLVDKGGEAEMGPKYV